MKKSLVLVLALVFVLSLSSAAFAAANPFVDVPAKHWAYDAVSQLAKAGIVDGYGDGTFRGDKTMTRYEMAQIVAKAMAKSDKADAATKATIDKLAVEFAAELNNLGVRVTKLEQNQSNLKFSGVLAMRYSVTDYTDTATASTAFGQYRLRLDGVAKVDDKTTFGLRFVTREPDKANLSNSTWQDFGANTQSATGNSENNIDRVFVTTKIGTVGTTIGRQSLYTDSQNLVIDSGAFSYDGAKFVVPSGTLTFTGNWGRFVKGANYWDTAAKYNADGSVKTAGAANTQLNAIADDLDVASLTVGSKYGKLVWNVGYFDFKNPVLDKSAMKLTEVNGIYNFTDKLSLNALYINNSADKLVATSGDDAWAAKVVYGDQILNKQGANNFSVQYVDKKANAFINNFTSLDATSGNKAALNVDYKMYTLQYNYAFSKNFNATLDWTKVDPSVSNTDASLTVSRVIVNVLF